MAVTLKKMGVNTNSIARFPYFNMKVADMKAWQLYVGFGPWMFVLVLAFMLLRKLIELVGLKSKAVSQTVDLTESLAIGAPKPVIDLVDSQLN